MNVDMNEVVRRAEIQLSGMNVLTVRDWLATEQGRTLLLSYHSRLDVALRHDKGEEIQRVWREMTTDPRMKMIFGALGKSSRELVRRGCLGDEYAIRVVDYLLRTFSRDYTASAGSTRQSPSAVHRNLNIKGN